MVLHLGGDYIVPVKNIIFILDYKKISENGDTFSFIENFKAEKINISDTDTKSVILSDFLNEYQLFFSPISCDTLKKRAMKADNIF